MNFKLLVVFSLLISTVFPRRIFLSLFLEISEYFLPLSIMDLMAIRVVEFSNRGTK